MVTSNCSVQSRLSLAIPFANAVRQLPHQFYFVPKKDISTRSSKKAYNFFVGNAGQTVRRFFAGECDDVHLPEMVLVHRC